MPPSPPAPGVQRDGPTVSVVLPALDEAANIAHVLHGLPDVVDEVVVVDGGSSDDTVAVARRTRAGTHVVRQTRSGKGNALACGIAASRGDIVILMSADGSCDPSDIPRFVHALSGGADAAHGSRFRGRGGDLEAGRLERIGGHLLRRRVNRAFGTSYTDVWSGYHAFWRTTLDDFGLPAPEQPGLRRGETVWGDGPEINPLIAVRMAALGLRVVEIAVVRYPRIHGARPRRPLARILRGRRVLRQERRRLTRAGASTSPAHTPGAGRTTDLTARPTIRPATGPTIRPATGPASGLATGPATHRAAEIARRAAESGPTHGAAQSVTGRHALPEAAPRRPYPGPRPAWADAVGQHRTDDMLANPRRRSGLYESGVHRAAAHLDPDAGPAGSGVHHLEEGTRRSTALYDTGVHRTGVYDTGVHRTEIYQPDDQVPREVGGGRRRLDAHDRRALPGPGHAALPGPRPAPAALPPGPSSPWDAADDNMPYAGRPGRLRPIPGERSTR